MAMVHYKLLFLLQIVWRASGHMPGSASGLKGTPGDAYHTDQLGGNVWVFNGSDPRIEYMQGRGRDGAQFPAWHVGHKQLSVGNKTVFYDAINSLVPWEFNGKILGTDEVVDSIVEGATFTRPYRGGVEQRFLPPTEFHLIYDEMLTDFPLLDASYLNLSDNPDAAVNASQLTNSTVTTKADHFGYMVTDTYLAEQLLTTLALNRFPPHVLDQYKNRTVAWTAPYWMTNCTVQLYVLLPYNNIVEFDIAYYDRYREKLPELNLPPALYWRGKDNEVTIEESINALRGTPRTEFNTYLCNLTWNSTLGMTFEQAGTNTNTGPAIDNRHGLLHVTADGTLIKNSSFYENVTNGTDPLIPLEDFGHLHYKSNVLSFAVENSDLHGSFSCAYEASASHSSSLRLLQSYSSSNKSSKRLRRGVLKLVPIGRGGSLYTATWFSGLSHGKRHPSCTGVAMKLSLGPQPEVFSLSIGFEGSCEGSKKAPSTLFFHAKSERTKIHDDDHGHGHEHVASQEHHHSEHGHKHKPELLLDGLWATSDGASYEVYCKQRHGSGPNSLMGEE